MNICNGCKTEREPEWAAREHMPAERTVPQIEVNAESPWLGLASFSEKTSKYFFGRSRELQEIFDRVTHRSFTLLFGHSGLGKTSLLHAGLAPRLREAGYLPIPLRIRHDRDAPSYETQTLIALADALKGKDLADLAQNTEQCKNLWLLLHDPSYGFTTASADARSGAPVPVFIIDQFEEIFTLGKQRSAEQADFREVIASISENRMPPSVRAMIAQNDNLADRLQYHAQPAKIVLAMRDDFLSLLERWRSDIPSVMENRFELRVLNGTQALEAVVEPGRFRDPEEPIVSAETGAEIVRFVAGARDDVPLAEVDAVPPLLSLICAELNRQRLAAGERTIRSEQLQGRSEDILEQFYTESFADLPEGVRTFVEDRLLSEAGYRQPINFDNAEKELSRLGIDQTDAERIIGDLVDRRLLAIEEEHGGGVRRVELAHDVLTGVARRSREVRLQRELAMRAQREVEEKEKEVLRQRLEMRRHRRVYVASAIGLIAIALALFVLLGLAIRARNEAQKDLSHSNFLQALYSINDDKDLKALAQLSSSLHIDRNNQAAACRLATLLSYRNYLFPLFCLGHNHSGIFSAEFSPDGTRIVTACLDGTAQVWDAQTGQQLTKVQHDDRVDAAQFSPDGKWIVTASEDKTARLWDAQTGKQLTKMQHDNRVYAAQFSPDGKWIVTASEDKTARLWDAQTGKQLTKMQHNDRVNAAQFSPDGTRIVTASWDKMARLWDAQTGKQLTEPMKHDNYVNAAQFSRDGTRIVTASWDGTARVWDAQTGLPVTSPMKHDRDSHDRDSVVRSAQFSPDGKWIVTASSDRTARVWDAKTGQALTEPMKHDDSVWSAQFSPDGKWIATASWDQTARLWDAQTGKALTEPMKHDDRVYAAQFSPDGKRIVTASEDKTAEVWNMQTGKALPELMRHDSPVNSAQFSRDGKRIVTASGYRLKPAEKPLPGYAQVWDADTGKPVGESMKHDSAVTSAQFSPDGKWIVTASGKMARVWYADTGKPLTKPMQHDSPVNSAQFSRDGKRIVTASGYQLEPAEKPLPGYARVWYADTGKPLTKPMQHDSSVNSAQFSRDGKRIVTASGKMAQVWDAQTGEHLNAQTGWRRFFQPPKPLTMEHDSTVTSAQFSPDGKRIVTASGKMAQVWDAQTGEHLNAQTGWRRFFQPPKPLTMEHARFGHVNTAQFSPDGQRIVTASNDKTARVWNAQTGKQLAEPMKHKDYVYSAQFSSDGKWIVTASEDGTACVWDAQTGKALTDDPMKHGDSLSSVPSDGKRSVMSWDKNTRVWNAPTGKQLTQPMGHDVPGSVSSAQFSPDGKRIGRIRIVIASNDGTARVWDIVPRADNTPPEWLQQLADAMAGQHFNDREFFESLTKDSEEIDSSDMLDEIKKGQLGRGSTDNDWVVWGRWFLADPFTRTISPFSKITVPQYIEDRIKENTAESLNEAEEAAIGNAEVLERIRKARENLPQTDNTHRD